MIWIGIGIGFVVGIIATFVAAVLFVNSVFPTKP